MAFGSSAKVIVTVAWGSVSPALAAEVSSGAKSDAVSRAAVDKVPVTCFTLEGEGPVGALEADRLHVGRLDADHLAVTPRLELPVERVAERAARAEHLGAVVNPDHRHAVAILADNEPSERVFACLRDDMHRARIVDLQARVVLGLGCDDARDPQLG
jgi:hypothetical protein